MSDDGIVSNSGGDVGGGGSSDGDVDDGYGSTASSSSSTGPTERASSPVDAASEDFAKRHNRELDALPCLACGENDDIPNTLLCARPVGREEDGRFCDKAYHVRCADLEDMPEGDVSELL